MLNRITKLKKNGLKIGFRQGIAFGLVVALLGMIIVGANISIKKLHDDIELVEEAHSMKEIFQNRYLDHIKWAQKISLALLESENWKLAVETDPHKCEFGKWYYGEGRKTAEKLIPELKEVLDSIEVSHSKIHSTATEIMSAMEKNNREEAIGIFTNSTLKTLAILETQITHINNSISKYADNINLVAELHSRNQKIKIGIMGFMAILISLVSGFLITRSVTKGINGAVLAANQLAEGKLNTKIEERYLTNRDEIGDLTRAVNETAKRLRSITHIIRNGAEEVAMASKHVNSASHIMSTAASQQAASVEQISATMDEMTASIHQNTENAVDTQKISESTAAKINDMMNAAIQSIESVRTITEKVNIINDIAAQTNILALNAAVESANAGDVGRGFAVVAAEVRKLAERSKAAASEIMELSQQTLSHTESAGVLMNELLPGIQRTAEKVKEISASSVEQSTATTQVNSAVQQLDHVTQENASASEELAESSTELAAQAEQLKEAVSFFKL